MDIYLRPFKESDWDDFLSWFSKKTKWMEFDAPWETNNNDENEIKYEFLNKIEISNRSLPSRLVISLNNGKAIGSVNRYYYNNKLALGICIYDDKYWHQGIGFNAFKQWINFWINKGEWEFYCQTWSGNIPMMKLAKKLGFEEVNRDVNYINYQDKFYDRYTYLLKCSKRFDGIIVFLGTNDLDKTHEFYHNIIGLPLYKDQGLCKIYDVFGNGKIGFCMHMNVNIEGKSPIITLLTNDVDEIYHRLLEKNIYVENKPKVNDKFNIYHFFVNDPNGYYLEIQKFL